jgi:hypothetical protein
VTTLNVAQFGTIELADLVPTFVDCDKQSVLGIS